VSEKNVDVLRRALAAYNARDIDAFIEHFHPGIELHSAYSAVGGADYRGHDGLRKFFQDFEEMWEDGSRVEPEAYFDLGDAVVSSYVVHGRRPPTGVEVDLPSALVARFQGGLIAYLKAYTHREDAFADLGVEEGKLEPIAP
jgi:ketosteroid isomerase-like protein